MNRRTITVGLCRRDAVALQWLFRWASLIDDGALPGLRADLRAAHRLYRQLTRVIGRPLTVGQCRYCGCTQDDCMGCIERTGEPCHWVVPDICSACLPILPSDLTPGIEWFSAGVEMRETAPPVPAAKSKSRGKKRRLR